jgi:hypothetical protein
LDNNADTHVWVEIKAYVPQNSKVCPTRHDLSEFAFNKYELGIKGVVGVKEKDIESFKNHPDWVHIDDALLIRTKKPIKDTKLSTVHAHCLYGVLSVDLVNFVNWINKNKKVLRDDVTDLVKDLPAIGACSELNGLISEAEKLGLVIPGMDYDAKAVEKKLKTVYNKVPCLNVLIDNVRYAKNTGVVEIFNTFTEEK